MSRKFTLEDAIRHQKANGFGPVLINNKPYENHSHDTGLGAAKPEQAALRPLEESAGGQTVHLEESPKRHRVRIIQYRKRKLDEFDNLPFSNKSLLDCLKQGALITDDSADWLECSIDQKVVSAKDLKTVIEIEEI